MLSKGQIHEVVSLLCFSLPWGSHVAVTGGVATIGGLMFGAIVTP